MPFARPGAGSAALLITLTLGLATAQAVAPDWVRRAGLDVWNLPELKEQFRQSNEKRLELEAEAEQVAARRTAADSVVAQLVAGGALADAADDLMGLLHDEPGVVVTLESVFPSAPSLRHLFALHAIERAGRLLTDDPTRRAVVEARLRAEYQSLGASSPEAPTIR
jgi:hypothetical protein